MVDVMKISEQLQTLQLQKKVEDKIVAYITTECQKANINPLPLPKFREGLATYDEPKFAKMANRLRKGAVLLAQVLDERESTNDK